MHNFVYFSSYIDIATQRGSLVPLTRRYNTPKLVFGLVVTLKYIYIFLKVIEVSTIIINPMNKRHNILNDPLARLIS